MINFYEEIKQKLIDILKEKSKDKTLEDSITNEDLSSYLDMICTNI